MSALEYEAGEALLTIVPPTPILARASFGGEMIRTGWLRCIHWTSAQVFVLLRGAFFTTGESGP